MMRKKASFRIGNASLCKQQMLSWANRFSICCFMDSHHYRDQYSQFDCLVAAGAEDICLPKKNKLLELKTFTQTHTDWLFGQVGYDLKNETEELSSSHDDKLQFPDLFFFRPQFVLYLKGNVLTIESLHEAPADIYREITGNTLQSIPFSDNNIRIQSRIDKQQYVAIINKLKEHILRGDCYEINFCQEFFAEETIINPIILYQQLSIMSPSPFAVYYKLYDKYALCASPERYMQKENTRLISQPIKGTTKRDLDNEILDNDLKQKLKNSSKDRIENVMITDLVRNDMSKICRQGTIEVTELFGVYSYPQVHQMITTVQGEVDKQTNIADALKATFPMGSMTGAPKRKVMELTEQYENSKRGLYSGSIGYITPDNNWDFNVIIRSILYNESSQYLSFQTGGAITFGSDAEEEYNECLLKAEAMQKALQIPGNEDKVFRFIKPNHPVS